MHLGFFLTASGQLLPGKKQNLKQSVFCQLRPHFIHIGQYAPLQVI